MLLSLSIRDFVIVDTLEIAFATGFTALTGETGAGKSILLDALGLLLGDRADIEMIRAGQERADLSGEFLISHQEKLLAWLSEESLLNMDDPDICLVRRVIETSGRSKAFINGTAVPSAKLKEIGEHLIDIHGQHAHQQLLKTEAQRELLDDYSGARSLANQTKLAYRLWQEKKVQSAEAERSAKERALERETLTFQINEVKALHFVAADWVNVNQTHHRLHHAASLIDGVQKASDTLADRESSCQSMLSREIQRLQQLHEYDEAGIAPILASLAAAEAELNEAVYSLHRYIDKLELDPAQLAELENRIQEIFSVARKYHIEPEQLPYQLSEWEKALAELENLIDIDRLKEEEKKAQAAYYTLAHQLSKERQRGALELADKVTEFMQSLAMQGSQFHIALVASVEPQVHGLESIEYQVATHSGGQLRALAKVASGGELSRISLALQVATSEVARVPTLIFDEVDVGIGGRVAEIVGHLLKRLGERYQVLCITHLPQVAACADHQFQVSKAAKNDQVFTQIQHLDEVTRIDEIARMLGGVEITSTTRQHAKQMLGLTADE